MIVRWLSACIVILQSCTTMGAPVYACDAWPIAPGALIRVYEQPNGLIFREYDTNGDKKADYGTGTVIHQGKEFPFPLLYAVGQDDADDTTDQPFKTSTVYIDRGGHGACEDIVLYTLNDQV